MRYFVRNRLLIGRKWGASWVALTPRILAYLLKAARAGCLHAAWAGVKTAYAAKPAQRRTMPKPMRLYITRNEANLRGSWFDRLRLELRGNITP